MDGWVDAEMDRHRRRQMQEQARRYFSLSWKQLKPCLNTLVGTRLGKSWGLTFISYCYSSPRQQRGVQLGDRDIRCRNAWERDEEGRGGEHGGRGIQRVKAKAEDLTTSRRWEEMGNSRGLEERSREFGEEGD